MFYKPIQMHYVVSAVLIQQEAHVKLLVKINFEHGTDPGILDKLFIAKIYFQNQTSGLTSMTKLFTESELTICFLTNIIAICLPIMTMQHIRESSCYEERCMEWATHELFRLEGKPVIRYHVIILQG